MEHFKNAKEREITKAQERTSAGPREKTGMHDSGVGDTRKGDVKGAQEGGSKAEAAHNPLKGATKELRRQHPHKHDDLGPHHETDSHIRHEPLHGMKPRGRR
jgi:hypothetical protein